MNTQNTHVHQAAQSVGITLEVFQGGFFLFDNENGQPMGHDTMIHEPWSEEDVLNLCKTLERGNATGVYMI